MSSKTMQFRERLAEIEDVRAAAGVLGWDQQTMMPGRGGGQRAEALGTLGRIAHELFVDDATGHLLEGAAAELDGAAEDSDAACLVRHVTRHWEKARSVPVELAAERARASVLGQQAWVAARRDSDFASFLPYLEHNVELARQYAECFDTFDCRYDALLDDFQPGISTAEVGSLFDQLKRGLVSLISQLSGHSVDDCAIHGEFPIEVQRQLVMEVVQKMGFDPAGWRLDDTVHPFATSFGVDDVRITTRWDQTYVGMALYGAMHECGHGLYEAGFAPELARTPIGHAESLGLHESQSRLWENMVGRGRSFSNVLAPRIADLFGGAVARLDSDTLFRAVNRVHPSLIRVEADEVTYGLHIIIRFELEQELIEGTVAVRDLPEVWNARYREYLGVEVPDDAHGVLQDVHWSAGYIGYFSTYSLGNMIAGQLWERVHADMPDLEDQIAAGELGGLLGWLRENVHRHGAKFTTDELLLRVVGGPIAVEPFVAYLKAKLGDVYGVELA